MLKRDLERIGRQLSNDLISVFRSARADELADLLPAVARLLRQEARASAAPPPRRTTPPPVARVATPRPRPAAVQAAPAAGAYADLVLTALSAQQGGMRSEELQNRVSLGTRELRIVLAHLVTTGQIVRRGQARGTRYALPGDTTPEPEDRVVESEVEVDPAALDAVRALLANSVMPMTLLALEQASKRPRDELRPILAKLVSLGLAVREGKGPGSRFLLAPQAAPAARVTSAMDASAGPPRVVRRAPRAKAWQVAAEAASQETQSGSEDPSKRVDDWSDAISVGNAPGSPYADAFTEATQLTVDHDEWSQEAPHTIASQDDDADTSHDSNGHNA